LSFAALKSGLFGFDTVDLWSFGLGASCLLVLVCSKSSPAVYRVAILIAKLEKKVPLGRFFTDRLDPNEMR
jgi:hypothetical protein